MYLSHTEILEKEDLDIVSVCVWPKLHAQMVFDCVSVGVRTIHCEKPMADNWADARLMVERCRASGIQLTFNHQRRFGLPFAKAKELLKSGEIGRLGRLKVVDGYHLRVMRKDSSAWKVFDTNGENLHGPNYISRAIANLVDSLENGLVPELDVKRVLQATEIIFASYESSRCYVRIDLPLTIDDNSLVSMIKAGGLMPEV